MSCKSAIHTVNRNFTAPANGQIPLGSPVRRFGRSMSVDGTGITCCEVGYYDLESSITLTPEAAGQIGVQFYANGQPVQGATAQGTGAVGTPLNLSVTALVRRMPCAAVVITAQLVTPDGVDTGATVDVISTVVGKM